MSSRVVLASLAVFAFAGFKAPRLPGETKGIYRFEKMSPASGGAAALQSGESFSITVGFKRATVNGGGAERDPRGAADEIIAKLSKRFRKFSRSDVQVTVARIYAATCEAILNVEVDDASKSESVRRELLKLFASDPSVSFAGRPGIMQVE